MNSYTYCKKNMISYTTYEISLHDNSPIIVNYFIILDVIVSSIIVFVRYLNV